MINGKTVPCACFGFMTDCPTCERCGFRSKCSQKTKEVNLRKKSPEESNEISRLLLLKKDGRNQKRMGQRR